MPDTALTNLPTAFLVLNEQLKPLSGSRKGFSVFGVRLRRPGVTEEILGAAADAIATSGFAEEFTVAVADIARPGGESSFRWERGDRMFDVAISQLEGEPVTYGVVFEDVTRQVQYEETRETARRYLEDILNNVQLGVVVLNGEMRVTNVNRAQEAFWQPLGVNVSWVEAIGTSISDLMPADAETPWEQITKVVLEDGQTYQEPRR